MGIQSLIIKDETLGREVTNEFVLQFLTAHVSVEDIIRERVRYEVEIYNRKRQARFFGLVQPSKAEASLNGYQLKKGIKINVEKQIETALLAFQHTGFFMLIDDVQAENLSDMVNLKPDMSVIFVKLTPLVGG